VDTMTRLLSSFVDRVTHEDGIVVERQKAEGRGQNTQAQKSPRADAAWAS